MKAFSTLRQFSWVAAMLVGVVAALIVTSAYRNRGERSELVKLVDNRSFNFAIWEFETLREKAQTALVAGEDYLSAEAHNQLVTDYIEQVKTVRELDRELERIYSAESDPEQAGATVSEQAMLARTEMERLQPVAEAILEQQTAARLTESGFDVLGETWPPVQMHMTPLPLMLIVSPRDDIRQKYAFPLKHGMSVTERDTLEEAILTQNDLSALVVPIGGLGVYPSMVIETSNMVFLTDVIAHEWAHHWLTLRPLGLSYVRTSQLRTVNETVASVFGEELGAQVLATYYPDLVPPPPAEPDPNVPQAPDTPPAFDFRSAMHDTRIEVDRLIAQGEIEQAEAYMEERRQVFTDNGYLLRKLNQAYFAFYGAYADGQGATGSDPVGPTVVALREQSASLRDFMDAVGPVTSYEQLVALLEEK